MAHKPEDKAPNAADAAKDATAEKKAEKPAEKVKAKVSDSEKIDHILDVLKANGMSLPKALG